MGTGYGAGAALFDAIRRRTASVNPPLTGQASADEAPPVDAHALDSLPPGPMGTIQTMAHALPGPVAIPRPPVGSAALEIKRASGDYASEPTSGAIKAAAGQPVPSRPLLSTRSMRPPVTPTIDAGGFSEPASPSGGLPGPPPAVSAGRAPLPPLRTYSPAYGKYEDEAAALPTESQYLEQRRPQGALARIGAGLKLGGRMLLASGLNPLYAAEGLGIGLADKDANAREQYRDYVEPRSADRQRRHLSMAGAEIGMQNTQADNARADEQQRIVAEQHGELSRRQAQLDQEHSQDRPYVRAELSARAAKEQAEAHKALNPTPRNIPPVMRQEQGTDEWIDFSDPSHPVRTGVRGPTPPKSGDTETDVTIEDVLGRPGGETEAEYRAREQAYMTSIDSLMARGAFRGVSPADGEELKRKWREDNKPRKLGEKRTTRKLGSRPSSAGAAPTGPRHQSMSAALAEYGAYVTANPHNRQRAREKFKQQNGVDPEAQ